MCVCVCVLQFHTYTWQLAVDVRLVFRRKEAIFDSTRVNFQLGLSSWEVQSSRNDDIPVFLSRLSRAQLTVQLTTGSRTPVEKLTVVQVVETFPPFMDTKGSLPRSQNPITGSWHVIQLCVRAYVMMGIQHREDPGIWHERRLNCRAKSRSRNTKERNTRKT